MWPKLQYYDLNPQGINIKAYTKVDDATIPRGIDKDGCTSYMGEITIEASFQGQRLVQTFENVNAKKRVVIKQRAKEELNWLDRLINWIFGRVTPNFIISLEDLPEAPSRHDVQIWSNILAESVTVYDHKGPSTLFGYGSGVLLKCYQGEQVTVEVQRNGQKISKSFNVEGQSTVTIQSRASEVLMNRVNGLHNYSGRINDLTRSRSF